MKKTILDYINLFLIAVLVFILALFAYSWMMNKEFDKLYWKAEIGSSSGNSSSIKSNAIQIIDAEFRNGFNHSSSKIDSDSKLLLTSTSKDSIYFRSQKELLPDTFHLKYFSIDERQFYEVTTSLPSFIIKKTIKNKNNAPKFFVEIQPKGLIILKINQKNLPSTIIAKIQALKITGTLKDLVFEKSLGKLYNRFKTIASIDDYADLFQNKYAWGFSTVLEEGSTVEEAYTYSNDLESKFDLQDLQRIDKRNIPKTFYIDWRDSAKHGIQYTFDPNEILQAFRKLDQTEGNSPIMITFKLLKDQMPKCEISKNGTVFELQDQYASLPN